MDKPASFEIAFCESIVRREPDFVEALSMLANLYTDAGRIDEGLELDQRIVELHPENPISHYNLACSLALSDRNHEALDALRKALKNGYQDLRWLMQDTDLKSLHPLPEFQALLAEFKNSDT